jgi:hypothetical protein
MSMMSLSKRPPSCFKGVCERTIKPFLTILLSGLLHNKSFLNNKQNSGACMGHSFAEIKNLMPI